MKVRRGTQLTVVFFVMNRHPCCLFFCLFETQTDCVNRTMAQTLCREQNRLDDESTQLMYQSFDLISRSLSLSRPRESGREMGQERRDRKGFRRKTDACNSRIPKQVSRYQVCLCTGRGSVVEGPSFSSHLTCARARRRLFAFSRTPLVSRSSRNALPIIYLFHFLLVEIGLLHISVHSFITMWKT